MKRSFALAIIGAGIAFSQDIVEISPFWAAYDSVKLSNAINDLYEDLVLPDSTPRTNRKYHITWESSDTLFLGHDGRINGRFVGENKEVSLTASIKNVGTSQRIEKKVFKVSIHGYEQIHRPRKHTQERRRRLQRLLHRDLHERDRLQEHGAHQDGRRRSGQALQGAGHDSQHCQEIPRFQ